MNMSAPFLQELATEAATTRRVLERVPESSLAWRPHAKSMSLGQLALHVATLPQQLSDFVAGDTLDFSAAAGAPPSAANHGALMTAFDESVAHAQRYLESLSDARAMATWTLTNGVTPLFSAPRIGVIRSFLFNHWYHHRGQLVVYLRLLDVPVPSVYGPTADENPFAASH
jgi:uncharacterized damage-inducible protein DinB